MAPPHDDIVSGSWRGEPAEFRSDRLIVSVKPGAPVGATLGAVKTFLAGEVQDLEVVNPAGRRWAVLQFSPLADAATRIPLLAEQLASRPDLRYAEPDFIGTGHLSPNDPEYAAQWWPQKIGIEGMWNRTRGATHVLLAIVDSGISIDIDKYSVPQTHEDLSHPRFILGHRINDVPVTHNYVGSFSFTGQSGNLLPRDGHRHGTHVAGIAAAQGNNGLGVAGANWVSPVYVARVLGNNNKGSASNVKLAVDDILRFVPQPTFWPSLFGGRIVINLSLGFEKRSESLEQMCEETSGGYVVICVAAGGVGARAAIDWPAALAARFEHVIAVGATDRNDTIKAPPGLDNYLAITLFAPGVDIPSTVPPYPCPPFYPTVTGSYALLTGSSQACAIVSGAVSLVWSLRRSLSPGEIRRLLIDTAVPAYDGTVEYPRINLAPFESMWVRRWLPWR